MEDSEAYHQILSEGLYYPSKLYYWTNKLISMLFSKHFDEHYPFSKLYHWKSKLEIEHDPTGI